MRILIADDDRELAGFMKAALAREGFAADAVYDGEEALLWARQDLYDVILLDVEMPKRDGFSVLKAPRAAIRHFNFSSLTQFLFVEWP